MHSVALILAMAIGQGEPVDWLILSRGSQVQFVPGSRTFVFDSGSTTGILIFNDEAPPPPPPDVSAVVVVEDANTRTLRDGRIFSDLPREQDEAAGGVL